MARSTGFANTDAWRPDRRITLVSALLVTALLFTLLTHLFRFVPPRLRSDTRMLLLHTDIHRRKPVVLRTQSPVSHSSVLAARPKPLPVPPRMILPLLEDALHAELQAQQRGRPVPDAAELGSALLKSPAHETIQAGQSYRNVFGDSVTRIGDTCYSLPSDMPGQSVGTAHEDWIYKVRAIPCPGTYVPNMADQLAEWVRKRQAHAPP